MTFSERRTWYPPVGRHPHIAQVRDNLYKLIHDSPIKFQDEEQPLPHAEYFKMYFGWLGSAEVNFGSNRDEFDIAHRALLATIESLDIGGDLVDACNKLYEDIKVIADLRGPRDYVYTVRDDTGRMWLELKEGVYISYLWELPSTSFQVEINQDSVKLPRECTYLFRRGELVGSSAVQFDLEQEVIERFITANVADCHVEIGDDNMPYAVFISLGLFTLASNIRFEVERDCAFDGQFPLEGVSLAKGRPWSLYELFAELVIARMITQNDIVRMSDKCGHLVRQWLRRQRVPEFESENDFVSAHDLHLNLGHATAPNRHVGAVIVALFRGNMRAMQTSAVRALKRTAVDGGDVCVDVSHAIRLSSGKCRVRLVRGSTEIVLTLLGMVAIVAVAVGMWFLDGKSEALALGAGSLPLGVMLLSLLIKIIHDRDLNDWISGYITVTRLSEIKREFRGDWKKVLLEPYAKTKFAPVNACFFGPELRGTIVIDEPLSVREIEEVGYEFGLEDSGHVGLRGPDGEFRRVDRLDRGLHVTEEKCLGRVWKFNASATQLADQLVLCPSNRTAMCS
ncbi:hypothetical protein BWQ96_08355 [Gracilariopsis chorda]|uniref:Uncharacterized protein n=1 Tax=Gracilariopsis chorda TaxID=448386 RepID=A0A2V3IIP6_9FLOR|nr:hypothetical protein BWQ96_08355 [Gracilariopsis chorda]|eukprot:PXF41903.1 hypothetical protein BWQ96_08355 [Gracilariopsis chorda]